MDPGADGHAETSLLRALHYTNGVTSVLELHGEADSSSRPTLREAISGALRSHPGALVINLDQLSFCDGGCAQDLLGVARLRRVGVAGAHGTVKRVLDLLDPTPHVSVDWVPPPIRTGLHRDRSGSPVGRDAPSGRDIQQ